MPPDAERFFRLYQRYRFEDQYTFYSSRRQAFTRAQNRTFSLSLGLIFLAALAGSLETLSWPWLKLVCLLTAVICPILSTALTGYNALFAFERQAKLYQDALSNLQKARVYLPVLQPGLSEADFTQQLNTYVQEVEKVLQTEQGQWGQMAKNMKPPEM